MRLCQSNQEGRNWALILSSWPSLVWLNIEMRESEQSLFHDLLLSGRVGRVIGRGEPAGLEELEKSWSVRICCHIAVFVWVIEIRQMSLTVSGIWLG
jgi:hypothetical protein